MSSQEHRKPEGRDTGEPAHREGQITWLSDQRGLATAGTHPPHFPEWDKGHCFASVSPHHHDSPDLSHSFQSSAKATTCGKDGALCVHRPPF